jgi:hypothetical protein
MVIDMIIFSLKGQNGYTVAMAVLFIALISVLVNLGVTRRAAHPNAFLFLWDNVNFWSLDAAMVYMIAKNWMAKRD